jgi:hypothetical protein
MIEEIRFGGREREKIVVQTRKGTSIENFVGLPASFQHDGGYKVLRAEHGAKWERRKPATGVYNCAGMVWANRRVALPEPQDWEKILVDDEYRQLSDTEEPSVGDIVVYRLAGIKRITHVARVCRINKLDVDDKPAGHSIVRALSKWGNSYGEDIHLVHDVFLDGGAETTISYYTDRPIKDPYEGVDRPLILA